MNHSDSPVLAPGSAPAAPAAAPAAPRARAERFELGAGDLRTRLTAVGTGDTCLGPVALTAWRGDRVEDREGAFVYLEEPARGRLWSVGAEPIPPRDGVAWCEPSGFAVRLGREEHGLDALLDVWIDPRMPLELRRVTLVNRTDEERVLRVTLAADVLLGDPAAHASHPAFSRLFVSTEWDVAAGALLARRRPRGEGETFPWLAAAVLEEAAPEYDGSRVTFLGRAEGRDRPRGLAPDVPLAGSTGSVLDPALVLRVTRRLPARGRAECTFALGAGIERAHVLDALAGARSARAAALFERARAASPVRAPARPRFVVALGDRPGGEATPRPAAPPALASERAEELHYWNGYGGFSADGREYVVRLAPDAAGVPARPPQPWVNVLANEHFGALVSETGAGATWSQNSREWRLTPWSNDPLLDPHGEALYVQDRASGAFFSVTPGPAPAPAAYEARHGFGATRFAVHHDGLAIETEVHVPLDESMKVTAVTVRNRGTEARALALVAYQQLVLGGAVEPGAPPAATSRDPRSGALLATRAASGAMAGRVAFAAIVPPSTSESWEARAFTCDRAAFLGEGGSPRSPRALVDEGAWDHATGELEDPCFAERVSFDVAPGEAVTLYALLGDAPDADAARGAVVRAKEPGRIALARDEALRHWASLADAVRVRTPSPALDLVANGWLAYQALACRMWARTAFYQSGGAFGFRDQLQDASALVPYRRELFRAQIVLHAAHQFEEGDVLHWWHPPDDRGLRTRFADDLLWLPYLAADYVRATGDTSVLDERAPYRAARALDAGEQEAFLAPTESAHAGDVYEHCVRAIERSLAVGDGAHGLPLFGAGDWNDGMNRVGKGGRGESVWMGFFQGAVLEAFAPLCEARGDAPRAARYRARRAELARALESAGWDGAWYRRGYFDDGAPLGSSANAECRIDALAQAWAVLSGMADPARAEQALDAVERELVDPAAGLVRLLAPPFERSDHDPGYIQGYLPGVRENGGQYTHAALWFVRALAEAGRRDRAARVLEMLSPVSHTQTPAQVATYKVEPYVVAADVYGVAPHVGHGGWTWYTGSAGWMSRVLLESILGVREEGGARYVVRPRIPDDWPRCEVQLTRPDGTVHAIAIENPSGVAARVVGGSLDGAPLTPVDGALVVPIARDGAAHRVRVELGPA